MKNKRVLIITYYWPPSGGSGVQRTLYFAKYLKHFGWEPIIYTVENGEFPAIDESLLKEIPEGTEVIKTKIWEPYGLYKKFTGKKKAQKLKPLIVTEKQDRQLAHQVSTWIRGNFFIPDARKFWIKPSIQYLTTYLKEHPVDLLFSSSPPQSVHLIALGVKKALNIPWVADFRDPWTKISYYDDLMLMNWADKKHKQLELEVLQTADTVITVSESCQKDFVTIGNREVQVVTNGFEDSIVLPSIVPDPSYFTISYTGTLSRDRNPISIWKGIQELVQENAALKKALRLRFIGNVDRSIFESLEELGLQENYEKIGHVPHSKVFDYLMSSNALLLIGIPNDKGVLTGKLFEYLFSSKPILSIGPKDGDIDAILEESQAGTCVDFEEKDAFKTALLAYFNKRHIPSSKEVSPLVGAYSRRNLTKKLADYFDQLVG